jgi:N-acyl-L-homoserine lactone synthetase
MDAMRDGHTAIFFRAEDDPRLTKQLFVYRKALFVDTYGWSLSTVDGYERDRFDNQDTIYSALYNDDEFVGMFRAIRADRPYLGETLFPELAAQRPFPKTSDYWEISRFGVVPGNGTRNALMNYAAMFHFAAQVGATGLVAIADLVYERFLWIHGIHSLRYGPPKIIGRTHAGHDIEAVAGEIPLAEQGGARFEHLLSMIDELEIHDVSQIFGPSRIPA